MAVEHVDVLIVGAGLSGVAAAYYVQTRCPTKSYAILEARDAIGGTWDLFRYPGVRSDSDMHTLGYSFRPWRAAKAIADGPSILTYVRETAEEFGIDRKMRFNHRARRASWSSDAGLWTVEAERGADGETATLTCQFLYLCTGYYEYDHGYTPQWPGMERFAGRIVHPQAWPEDLDYTGKRVVVIGSGATAVTLVPAMAEQAEHVTMLQRSPTYIVARPSVDRIATMLHHRLPFSVAAPLVRWKNIALGMYFYNLARRQPAKVKQGIIALAHQQLGPDFDVETHLSPSYNPWDQRLCLIPDADLFNAIKAGTASIVTDQIETFTETGLRLQSGEELPADIIVTATGLRMRLMAGLALTVDGAPVDLGKTITYRGMMYGGVPNLASSIGYINASWTLKCELIARYVCRLLNYMDRHRYVKCLPQPPENASGEQPVITFSSGYVQRALDTLPKQSAQKPWRSYQNYVKDVVNFRLSRLNDGALRFSPQTPAENRVKTPAGARTTA